MSNLDQTADSTICLSVFGVVRSDLIKIVMSSTAPTVADLSRFRARVGAVTLFRSKASKDAMSEEDTKLLRSLRVPIKQARKTLEGLKGVDLANAAIGIIADASEKNRQAAEDRRKTETIKTETVETVAESETETETESETETETDSETETEVDSTEIDLALVEWAETHREAYFSLLQIVEAIHKGHLPGNMTIFARFFVQSID